MGVLKPQPENLVHLNVYIQYSNELYQIFQNFPGPEKEDPKKAEREFRELADERGEQRLLFAELAGRIAGYAIYTPLKKESAVSIDRLYVNPRFQRFGVGRDLVEHIIGEAKQIEAGNVFVIPIEESKRFYEEMGFIKSNESDFEAEMHLNVRKTSSVAA
jgi:N-acetylglutamate synthase-like GNAT family acetyltransferase